MQLTKLEKKCLGEALEYAICDYEENLIHQIEYDFEKSSIKEQRQVLKGMQRVQAKLLKEVA
jgi:hypothetical protein|tara:strand:- start:501 stop:686 length:186 start_codon:yes stop_codon:yes gene_type:complete